MTLKLDIIDLNRRHPTWPVCKIAEFLDTTEANVRHVGWKFKLRFSPKAVLSVKRRHKRIPYAGYESGGDQW